MSVWTSISATIVVDFGNESRYWIEKFFSDEMNDREYTLYYDPQKKGDGCEITGSEMNAAVTYVQLRDFEKNPRCRYYHRNKWVINVFGNLRDRRFEETLAEWRRFGQKFGRFFRRCRRLDGLADSDDACHWADLLYWNVDIVSGSNHYHKCSIKRNANENT